MSNYLRKLSRQIERRRGDAYRQRRSAQRQQQARQSAILSAILSKEQVLASAKVAYDG